MRNKPRIAVIVCWVIATACVSAGDLVTELEIGKSVEGRPLSLTRLAGDGPRDPDDRPAMLIVAGLDGDVPASTTVATGIVDRLAAQYVDGDETVRSKLQQLTIYVLPQMNPDGQALSEASPMREHVLNCRPWDDDRDGVVDEDGPDDLNADGMITMMRVRDPEGEWLADADEPRLLRKADRAKGETPVYKVYVEGIDNDGDGYYNEDAVGGVDLNANFMHGYVEHGTHAGPHQISEPESRALIEFVLDHPRIGMVLTIGRHNNLVKVEGSDKKDETGKAPVGLHKDDVAIYKHVSSRYKELTGVKKAADESSAGAFFAWAYSQYGVPSFATTAWQRPEPEKPDASEDDEAGDEKDDSDDNGDEKSSKKKEKKGSKEKGDKKDESFEEDRRWLEYAGNGPGFVDWTRFEHPTLGEVEIGGFSPTLKRLPNDDVLAKSVSDHEKFVLELAGMFPSVKVTKTLVKDLGGGLFDIEVGLTNSGYFPTGLVISGLNRRVKPMVVTLDINRDRIVGGEKVHKVRRIDGSGGYREFRWVVRGRPNDTVVVKVVSEKLGDFEQPIVLKETVKP